MRKSCLGLVPAVVFALAATAIPASAQPTGESSSTPSALVLSPAPLQTTVGSTFSETVILKPNGASINAVQANLTYPTKLLTCESVSVTNPPWSLIVSDTCDAGTVEIVVAIPDVSTSVTGSVAVVTFQAARAGHGKVTFTAGDAAISSPGDQDVLGRTRGCKFTVAA